MNEYELSLLINENADYENTMNKVRGLILNHGGTILSTQDDGVKRLAYSISGQDYARYTFVGVMLPIEAPAKISSQLNITDEVLRYLLVRVDNRQRERATTPETEVSSNNLNGSF